MNMRKDFEIRYRIRQVICAILGVCIAALLTGILVERRMEWVEAKMSRTQETLAKEVLRFHVLANSDSEEDQAVKLKVRDRVLAYMEENMTPELKEEPDAGKTRAWIEAHLDEITDTAGQVLKEEGFSYGCASELELAYFPDKQYGDIFFPQGSMRRSESGLERREGITGGASCIQAYALPTRPVRWSAMRAGRALRRS